MTDTIEAVARAIANASAEAWENRGVCTHPSSWHPEAQAAHTKALIEGAGELEQRLERDATCMEAWANGLGPYPATVRGVSKKQSERARQAAATIAALKAENERLIEREAQAKLDGVRAGIEASALLLERDDGFGEWWDAAQFVRSELDAEAIAKDATREAALSDLIAECTFFLDKPDTLADSDGDDGA